MKKMKKFLSVLLASAMTLAMAAPGFAAPTAVETPEDGFTITINNTHSGHEYEAYQIFKGDLALDDQGKKILSNIEWGDSVTGRTDDAAALAATLSGKTDDGETAREFAANINSSLSSPVKTSTPTLDKDEKVLNYTITDLQPGYYLIKDKAGTLESDGLEETYTRFILQVVADVDDVKPKSSEVPGFEKTVGDETKKGDDYNIGDHVPFTLTATIPASYGDYTTYTLVFEDTLTNGLTFDQDTVKLKVDGTVIDGYSATFEGQTMTLNIADAKQISAITAGSVVTVTYTATLNNQAAAGTEQKNSATLEYSNDPNGTGTGKTVPKEAKVHTFKLALTKVAAYEGTVAEEAKTKLAGAEFTLQNNNIGDNNNLYAVVENGKITGWATTGTTLVSDANGLINVDGLDAGDYTLTEIKAPAGYNLLAAPIALKITSTIDADGELEKVEITYGGKTVEGAAGVVAIEVQNNSGAQLPSTGGIGTTIFYAAGIILMAGAVFFVVRRKRA